MAPLMKLVALATLAISTALAITAAKVEHATAATINSTTVTKLDLSRYMGLWYEVARFENRFERNLINVTAHYTMLPDGKIEVVNRGYNIAKLQWSSATGKAKRTSVPGKLKVAFFWIFYAQYNILALGDSSSETSEPYPWALVGSKSNKYLWILSRTESLDAQTTRKILAIAEARGYDISNLLFRLEQPDIVYGNERCCKVVSSNATHNAIADNIVVRFVVDNMAYLCDMIHYRVITSNLYLALTSGTFSDELQSLTQGKKSVANKS